MDDQLIGYRPFENASPPWLPTAHDPEAITLGVLENVLDAIDYGVIVIGSLGNILLTNQLTRTELEASSCIRIQNDRLSAYSTKNTLAIEHAIFDAKNGLKRLVQISSGKETLTLSFALLTGIQDSAQTLENFFPQLVLVLLGKRTACPSATLTEFAKIHGLSGAEQRLLPAICRGECIKEMAQQHGISIFTVRTQLKSIRVKTGATTLRRLMLLLMSLPPLRI